MCRRLKSKPLIPSCVALQRLFILIPLNYQRNVLQAHTGETWGFVERLLGAEKGLKKDLQFWLSYGIIKEKQRR